LGCIGVLSRCSTMQRGNNHGATIMAIMATRGTVKPSTPIRLSSRYLHFITTNILLTRRKSVCDAWHGIFTQRAPQRHRKYFGECELSSRFPKKGGCTAEQWAPERKHIQAARGVLGDTFGSSRTRLHPGEARVPCQRSNTTQREREGDGVANLVSMSKPEPGAIGAAPARHGGSGMLFAVPLQPRKLLVETRTARN
jgi:hypothetical protein